MGSINSETPYLHQVKWRGTLYFLTKRSTWNISIFRYTFHDNTPQSNRYTMEEGRGITYTNGGGGVSKITIIIGIEHYTPTSPLH
jgi:hypothetical protein